MPVVTFLRKIFRDTRGATAVEYGLIITMIVIAMVASLQNVANSVIEMWGDVEEDVTTSDTP